MKTRAAVSSYRAFSSTSSKTFLHEIDPTETWRKHLTKVAVDDGDVVWVSPGAEQKVAHCSHPVVAASSKSSKSGSKSSVDNHSTGEHGRSDWNHPSGNAKLGAVSAVVVAAIGAFLYLRKLDHQAKQASQQRSFEVWRTKKEEKKSWIDDVGDWVKKKQRAAKKQKERQQ
eukprot:COSAG02_NODE_26098_length_641_cov_0.699262_1_plen_171_part_00